MGEGGERKQCCVLEDIAASLQGRMHSPSEGPLGALAASSQSSEQAWAAGLMRLALWRRETLKWLHSPPSYYFLAGPNSRKWGKLLLGTGPGLSPAQYVFTHTVTMAGDGPRA